MCKRCTPFLVTYSSMFHVPSTLPLAKYEFHIRITRIPLVLDYISICHIVLLNQTISPTWKKQLCCMKITLYNSHPLITIIMAWILRIIDHYFKKNIPSCHWFISHPHRVDSLLLILCYIHVIMYVLLLYYYYTIIILLLYYYYTVLNCTVTVTVTVTLLYYTITYYYYTILYHTILWSYDT